MSRHQFCRFTSKIIMPETRVWVYGRIPLLAERISRMLESLEQERAFETPPTATPTAVPSYLAKSPAGPPSHQRPTSTPPTDKASMLEL